MIKFEELSIWFIDKFSVHKKNRIMRRTKKSIERKYNLLVEEMNELNHKYIKLLEEKSNKFDLYIQYKDQCESLTKERKELKKQNTLLNEQIEKLSKSKRNKSKGE